MNSIKNRLVCNGVLRIKGRDSAVNWIALGVLLAAWHLEADLDRTGSAFKGQAKPGAASAASHEEPYWLARPSRERSWLARACGPAPPAGAG